MAKFPLIKDERQHQALRRIASAMYVVNIILLSGMLFYRQMVLNQPIREYEDLAILITFNALFFLSALLYLGGIPFPKVRMLNLLLIYIGFVGLGILFTGLKYFIFLKMAFSWPFILQKAGIIAALCGAIMLLYGLFAYLGYRRMEKDME